MGVPKFFRYISERYPCLSELVKEYQIPEFDNLYLDMNGIIHMCSHPDDGNPHFRITEEKIFRDIFHYIEVLFRMIRPQKLFFMAIDGVAPRAKMNQQRGRRFRSAKDAEKQEDDAIKKGEKLPQEARFDSNCITPGTVFMARLHKQLQYFVVDKISNDRMWQKCKVILSGHETPGEGEHKIMDYIRYMRAQPNYDPNTRHCLYGLDADLIMLGLCTHEPHFSLLREEVKFGKKSSSKRTAVPEETTFFLLHLSLMREYLELEFAVLKDKLKGFTYDFEKIIDDWVLMGFLVGNDFIPHLPNLHIANGALPILYKAYMDVLPELDGYINESGNLNLARFEKFMGKLSSIDLENFEEIRDDLLYMEAKTGRKSNAHYKVSTKNLEEWIPDDATGDVSMESLEPTKQPPRDSSLAALIKETDDMCIESENDEEFSLSEEDEAFGNFKKEYYLNKLEYAKVTPEVMRDQAEGYVRAIQWNLNYYYNGCCSWSWYYPHHYAPYISDIKGFADLKIEFDSGKPFLPYEQLLAVLPTASKDLLPSAYHDLMTEENSLIKKYYPVDFQTDLNGKRQEWEAVVLVPFIDEKLLLEAMSYCNDELTEEEKDRNRHGPMLIYTFTPRSKGVYQAPKYFPQVGNNHTEIVRMNYNDILVPQERLVKGAYPGVKMGVYYPGFPTMKHLQYKAKLKKAKIKVFEQPSRSDNMIITIIPDTKKSNDKVPVDLLGTTIFVGWPHLVEAKVVAISNENRKYVSAGEPGDYNVEEMGCSSVSLFKQEVEAAVEFFQHRWGIEVGETKVLVHVRKMIGRRYSITPNGRVTLEKEFAPITSRYPLQTIVYNISSYDSCQAVFRDIEHVFPKGSVCFLLTNPYYGCQGVIEDSRQCKETGRIKISITATEEPNLSLIRQLNNDVLRNFKNVHTASGLIGCSPSLYTRLTGSLFLTRRNNEGGLKNVNIGLDLKFNKKNKETPGYTKKMGNVWYYSDATSQLVKEYCKKFPKVVKYVMREHNYEEIAIEKIYGDNWEEKLKEMQNWLKSLPSYSIERQICGSSALTPQVIKALEDLIDAQGNVVGKKVVMQVKPGLLYRPEIQNGSLVPDPSTDTYILDRIINVREGFSVPLGLKGTVVAIREPTTGIDRDRMYDVLFDKPFKDGLALDCSEGRGYRLPPTAFINISFGVRMKELKSGKTDEVITKVEPAYHPSYQAKPEQKVPQVVTPMNNQWYPGQPLIQQPRYPIAHQNSAFAQFSVRPPPYNMPQDPRATQYFVPPHGFDARPQVVNYSYQMPVVPPMYQPQPTTYAAQAKAKPNPPMPALPTFNNFMPNFASGGSQQQVQQNPVHVDAQLVTAIKTDKTPETETTETAKTDFLKSLLKVGEVKGVDKPAKKEMPPPIAEKKQEVVDEKPSSVDLNQLVQVSNIPASIRLLTFYQSNGLGMPRYQYFNTGNQVQAQISVGKETINGSPASSREEASENVAKDVLELLMSKAKNGPQINDNFPPPPKTWVQPETTGKSKQKNTEARHNLRSCSKAKIEATTILNNSFVPLQAVKNHIKASNSANSSKDAEEVKENIETLTRDNAGKKASKLLTKSFVPLQAVKNHIKVTKSANSSKDAEEIEENIETLTCDIDGEKAEKASKGHMMPEGNTSSKPKKGRKTRIAANFLKKD